jgi:hypothetical protein
VLIKFVAQSIPTYSMSYFKLPKGWCDDVSVLMAMYWWGQSISERKIHWFRWDRLCHKKEDGGLGFKEIHAFNQALLAKQGWRLLSNPQSLFYKVFKAKYFPHTSFLKAKLGSRPSFVWRSILAAREVLSKSYKWLVGDGRHINSWEDGWLSKPSMPKLELNPVEWV